MKIPRTVLSAAFILSLAGFGLGLVLHGLTFLGFNPQISVPMTWYSVQLITALRIYSRANLSGAAGCAPEHNPKI